MDIRLLIGGYLYIAIAVIFIIDILKRIIKKERVTATDRTLPVIIVGIGFLYIIALAFYYSEEIGLSDKLQILLMFGLVAVTTFYAWSASRQANASVTMAEEMKEQRVIASRPVIIQKAVYEKDVYEGSMSGYFSHFEVYNAGKSPAIELEISLTDKTKKNALYSIRQTFLRADDTPIKFRPYNPANLEESATYYLACEYQSIFSRGPQQTWYQTWLPFEPVKSSEKDKIYVKPGELEFREVSEKDRIGAFTKGSKPK